MQTREDFGGCWWTFHFVRPANLDAEGRPWTLWKHSQGAGIETRAAHHENLNDHARDSQRSQNYQENFEEPKNVIGASPGPALLAINEAHRDRPHSGPHSSPCFS